jgi:hypothetical protein
MPRLVSPLPIALATVLATVAACRGGGPESGQGKDTLAPAEGGGLSAPAVGATHNVNGNGINDSNAARPAATGGSGAANNSGIGSTGATTGGANAAGETGTATGAAGAGAPAVGPVPRPGVPGTDTASRRRP